MPREWGIAMWEEISEATESAAIQVGKELGEMQERLIHARQKPDGSAQQARKTTRDRGRKNDPPMYKTGRLANPSKWRVRRKQGGVSIRPPKDREAAVAINETRGFSTVFEELPAEFEERLQEQINENLEGITPAEG